MLIVLAAPAAAGEWRLSGEVSSEVRYYPREGLYQGQFDHWQPSLSIEPDLRWDSADGAHRLVVIPFFRSDSQDAERTHADLREAYYRYGSGDGWSLTLGAAKVFWGKTESRHLVDIINQTDAVEDVDEEDKLGQPMANLTLLEDWGVLDLFVMPGFRDRTSPGREGRPYFGFPVEAGKPIFESDWGRGAVDVAARYSNYIGNWDLGLSIFHGTARAPRLALASSGTSFLPVYDRITQGSLDLQHTTGAWLWKLEVLGREGQGSPFFASVAGFEYTLFQIFGSVADLGLLAEYQYDGRDKGIVIEKFGPTTAAPPTVADNDVFLGARLALNDPEDSTALAGLTIDTNDQSMAAFVEARRRLSENWTAEFEARLFMNTARGNPAFAIRDDDSFTLRVTRHF